MILIKRLTITDALAQVIIICSLLMKPTPIQAHEIFSARADLARQTGINLDHLIKYTKAGSQYSVEYNHKIMYGLAEYVTIEARLPIFLRKKISEFNNNRFITSETSGLGKVEVVSKLRIFHDYGHQRRNQAVVLCGMLFPTASTSLSRYDKKPIIANRSFDFLVGAAGAFETIKIYHFVSLVYRINTSSRNLREGNIMSYSYSFGYRPKKPQMDKVDWVYLIDFDGIWSDKDKINACKQPNTGKTSMFLGASFFRSKGNVMIKGGIQIPIVEEVNGTQEKTDFKTTLGVFAQF